MREIIHAVFERNSDVLKRCARDLLEHETMEAAGLKRLANGLAMTGTGTEGQRRSIGVIA